jgi:hypothetical protein
MVVYVLVTTGSRVVYGLHGRAGGFFGEKVNMNVYHVYRLLPAFDDSILYVLHQL